MYTKPLSISKLQITELKVRHKNIIIKLIISKMIKIDLFLAIAVCCPLRRDVNKGLPVMALANSEYSFN